MKRIEITCWIMFVLMAGGLIINAYNLIWPNILLFSIMTLFFYNALFLIKKQSEPPQLVSFGLVSILVLYFTIKGMVVYFPKEWVGMDWMIKHSMFWDTSLGLLFATIIYAYFTFLMFYESKKGNEIMTLPILLVDIHGKGKPIKTNDNDVKALYLTIVNDSRYIAKNLCPKLFIKVGDKTHHLLTFKEIPFLNPQEIIDNLIGAEVTKFLEENGYVEESEFFIRVIGDEIVSYSKKKQEGTSPLLLKHPKTRKIGNIISGSLKFELSLEIKFDSLYSKRPYNVKDNFSFEWIYNEKKNIPYHRIIKSSKRFGWNVRLKENALLQRKV